MNESLCIVLRAVNYRDNDRILTLFSRKEGKLTASARGVRSMKSGLATATQPFCCAEYEFNQRNGRLYIKSALVKEEYYHVQNDYDLYMAGCVMLELTEKILEHTHEYERLFAGLANTLYTMEKEALSHMEALAYYLVRVIEIMGVFPALDFCAACGAPIEEPAYWNAQEGGAVCGKCAGAPGTVRIGVPAVKNFALLRHEKPGRVPQSRESMARFIGLANDYLTVAGEIRLKTMQYFQG